MKNSSATSITIICLLFMITLLPKAGSVLRGAITHSCACSLVINAMACSYLIAAIAANLAAISGENSTNATYRTTARPPKTIFDA